ncbi:MAG: hypothetical protein IJE25_06990 [Clostridia bacterium]|nr:hypothetical protein [Clostridia bacterium]
MKKRIIAMLLALAICLSLFGCEDMLGEVSDAINGAFDAGGENTEGGEVVFPEGEEQPPSEWVDGSAADSDATAVHLTVGESADLSKYFDGGTEGLEWSSACPTVVSVENGIITANKVGRTEIVATAAGVVAGKFAVTSEFMITGDGYGFTTTKVDGTTYKVTSLYEANRIIDASAANHVQKLTIDFSGISEDFNAKTDFDLNSEFGSHTSLKMSYYPSTAYLVNFEIIYNEGAASYTTPQTEERTYKSVKSANSIIRSAFSGEGRADDFDDFAIELREKTLDVYNSEELWWAVEHGYKPTFPMEGTKAELFYERAKMILRDIITDGMSDYEKALAIYEYLIEAVSYDYDAYYNAGTGDEEKRNTCYYLEGVFEVGRAVCDGKSKAYVLLCGIEGIECVRDFGSSVDGGAGHAWNYVKIDGEWYMVDTTEGDIRYESTSSIAQYLDGRFETVGYGSFLAPTYSHADKYVYTDMWADIVSLETSKDYPKSYFDTDLGDTSYDFIINNKSEVSALFARLAEGGMPREFVLTFLPYSSFMTNSYFMGIESTYGLEMSVYTVQSGGETVYVAIFKAVE